MVPMPQDEPVKRLKIVFDNREAVQAAMAMDSPGLTPRVSNPRRGYISVEAHRETGAILESTENSLDQLRSVYGARVVEDFRYDLETQDEAPGLIEMVDEAPDQPSLDDVVEAIRATAAWSKTRGEGVNIAVVDTGVDGNRPEIGTHRRVGSWQVEADTPWTDWQGHGTMCAVIAAGSKADGGEFNGVAPMAGVIACKTRFYDSELTAIYDMLIDRVGQGETIVATNSFGFRSGTPPGDDPHADFPTALKDAIDAGVHVYFSGGNNHALVGGGTLDCAPNSIWRHKSWESLAAVGTTRLDNTIWYYSSRGPGQYFGQPDTNRKPDFVAPTPENGRVVYGSGVRTLKNGWGTSGACPQAAGLAALMLALDKARSAADIRSLIEQTCDPLGLAHECCGAGRINCKRAVDALLTS